MPPDDALPIVHILGGGCGAMAAAFELSKGDWKSRYSEIVVHQKGWRLGGKGASGRDPSPIWGRRIEEHGLHIWAGMYHHAFKMMRACYAEWQGVGAHPRPFEDAFSPHSHVTLMDPVDGQWERMPVEFPTNDLVPGDGGAIPSPWEFMQILLSWMEMASFSGMVPIGDPEDPLPLGESGLPDWVLRIVREVGIEPPPGPGIPERWERYGGWMSILGRTRTPPDRDLPLPPFFNAGWTHWITYARSLAHALPDEPRIHRSETHQALDFLLAGFAGNLFEAMLNLSPVEFPPAATLAAHQLGTLVDLAAAAGRGMLFEGVWIPGRGFDDLDDWELSDWLAHWGARPESLESGLMRAAYEYVFAFEDGDVTRPSQAAGTALRGLLRLLFTYKGAFFWKMMGSMGQTVFTPFYEVLKQRGVRFEFFHRVRNIGLSADGKNVESLTIARQVTPKAGYPYLTTIATDAGPLDDWPNAPVYEMLDEGDSLSSSLQDLESSWSIWNDAETLPVSVAPEDRIVLAIPVAELARICPELIATHPAWAAMTEKVKTVRTCALQLWFAQDTVALGWPHPGTILSGYERPFATWADLTSVLAFEDWPAAPAPPAALGYLVGVMRDDDPPNDFGNPQTPGLARQAVAGLALDWLGQHAVTLWPNTGDAAQPGAFDFSFCHDPESRNGGGRFNAQYWRANIEPSDRYVQYVPGSVYHRLPADDPNVENLFLAGDWVRTGLNAGAVECAVMGGIQAARAILGLLGPISGESDF